MNTLASTATLLVHDTDAPATTNYQVTAAPKCRKVQIAGYVSTPETALRPVNCPRCLAKRPTV